MKNSQKFLLIALSALLLVSCGKDSLKLEEGNLDRTKLVQDLKESINYLKTKHSNYSFAKKKSNIKEVYKSNLAYISSKTGIQLEFNEDEFNVLVSILENVEIGQNSTVYDVSMSYDNYLKSIEEIKLNGSYELFMETQEIINEVYSVDDSSGLRASIWGCGVAIAANYYSTIGLSACLTGIGCPAAVTAKLLSLAGIAFCL